MPEDYINGTGKISKIFCHNKHIGGAVMGVLLIHPNLTIQHSNNANQFFQMLREELEQHIELVAVSTANLLKSLTLSSSGAIIMFNCTDGTYSDRLLELLAEAKTSNYEIISIAIDKEMRTPPDIIKENQSFDVYEYLKSRCLSSDFLEVAAIGLARTIVSRLQPTLSKESMQLFLSYRRFDGEDFTRAFHQELKKRPEKGFRDLSDIHIGEDAQDVIEGNLRKSDAVIFLDTPKSGESPWITRELAIALSLNLPIIWVKLGPDKVRTTLNIKPAAEPHFNISTLDLSDENIDNDFIDQVIKKAFEISREHASTVFDHLHRIKSLNENQVIITEIDKKHMLYEVQIPRPKLRYPQKPISHLLQFYGRSPQEQDCDGLLKQSQNLGRNLDLYDASILLGITPLHLQKQKDSIYIDSCSEYISLIEANFLSKNLQVKPKGVIISGAFPQCDPQYQQCITNAVHAFAQVTFDKGNKVIFGGHPTFQHLIFDMARLRRPDDYIDATHLYVSEYFVGAGAAKDFNEKATTFVTKCIENDRDKSLTHMRKAMIEDASAAAMVVIGGKTALGGHVPGVDEEIQLAIQAKLPVFIVGTAGGRSAEIAIELDKNNWMNCPNGLSVQQNKQLLFSTDYFSLANMVLRSIDS